MQVLRHLLLPPAFILIAGAAHAGAVAPPPLRDIIVPHRAVYDIELARTESGSGVAEAKGRMVFELTGSVCAGYSMRQRMVVDIVDEDGNVGKLDFRIVTFESGDGDVYSFDSKTAVNQQVVESVAGEARRKGGSIEVALNEPAKKTVTLDGDALFPSQHLQAIIDAAEAKRHFLSADIYEGAGTGEASDAAAAAIGDAMHLDPEGLLRRGVRHWPVSVGYFGGSEKPETVLGEELPTYQMSFTLYENGVTNNLRMDYGNYAFAGSMQSIEPLAKPDCDGG